MMMSTFLGLTVTDVQKEEIRVVNEEVDKFNCLEVFADNYRYRGAVENHNALRNDGDNKYQFVWRVNGKQPGGPS